MKCGVQFIYSLIYFFQILCFVSFFQFIESSFDWTFFVGRNLIANLFQLFLCLENHCIGLVQLVHTLFFFSVGFGMCSSFFFHALDFFFGQTRRCFNADMLFFTRGLIFSRYIQDTVCIDIESNFNLRHSTRCRGYPVERKHANEFIVASHWSLTLQHVNLNRRLIIGSSREYLALAGGYGCIGFDQFGHYATKRFDTQRKRSNIEQQYVFDFTRQNGTLNGSTDSNYLVGVDTLVGSFTEKLLYQCLNSRDTG